MDAVFPGQIPAADGSFTRNGQKILVADDQAEVVQWVQVILERNVYRVVTAYDGVEALDKVKTENPDLIVCDVMMPRKDGFEVLRELKADPSTRDIPLIMLTAKAQDADVLRGWASGVDCYLTKPFNETAFLQSVRRILAKRRRSRVE